MKAQLDLYMVVLL